MNALAVLTENDDLLTFGKNEQDVLGHLNRGNLAEYIIETPKTISQVAIGLNHVIITGSKETKKVESTFSHQVVEDTTPIQNIIEAEIAAVIENGPSSAPNGDIKESSEKNDAPKETSEEGGQEKPGYQGKNYDPNFNKFTKRIPDENAPKRGYVGRNFNPNYKSEPIKVHHNPAYQRKNFDPNYKKPKPSSEYGYKGKNYDPDYYLKKKQAQRQGAQPQSGKPNWQQRENKNNPHFKQSTESSTESFGYKGRNYDPDYYKKKYQK